MNGDSSTQTQEVTLVTNAQTVSDSDKSLAQRNTDTKETTKDDEEQKKYRLTQKFQDWVKYFTTKGFTVEINGQLRKTYGNRTTSAIKAYDLDPVKQYTSASVIGTENFRKLRDAGSYFAEDLELGYDKMVEIGKAKMGEKGTKMWELMMDTLGYRDIVPTTLIQQNTQNNYNVPDSEAKDFSVAFKRFLEQE